MKKNELKKMVYAALIKDKQSRNDDVRLTQVVWYDNFDWCFKKIDGKYYINTEAMKDIPREDQISRIRRKLQEECLKGKIKENILPTREDIVRKRRMNEIEWYKFAFGSTNV
jgi:hypothetical protein